jgi:hypothetical protein
MGVFQDWKSECEAVEREMDRIIAAGRPASGDQRQVRKIQFEALIERRETAARKLLPPHNSARRVASPALSPIETQDA